MQTEINIVEDSWQANGLNRSEMDCASIYHCALADRQCHPSWMVGQLLGRYLRWVFGLATNSSASVPCVLQGFRNGDRSGVGYQVTERPLTIHRDSGGSVHSEVNYIRVGLAGREPRFHIPAMDRHSPVRDRATVIHRKRADPRWNGDRRL